MKMDADMRKMLWKGHYAER